MKFCSFSVGNRSRFGFQFRESEIVDLHEALEGLISSRQLPERYSDLLQAPDLKSWLARGQEAADLARKVRDLLQRDLQQAGAYSQEKIRFLPPIPNPSKVIAIGLNYKDHAAEQNVPLPDRPLIFAKFPTTLIATGEEIRLPSISRQVDPEAELCIVIGKTGKKFSEDDARLAIAGYMVGNDVSARDLQFSDKQWVRGKSCDTFAPTGPFLATEDEVGDPHRLNIELRVNGETRQSSNTRNLIFNCYVLVSFISQAITLQTGDIIFTGTPSGVGVFRQPPVFLKSGDVVEVTIEKIGVLKNPVVAELVSKSA